MNIEASALRARFPEGKLIVNDARTLTGLYGLCAAERGGPGLLGVGSVRDYGPALPPGAFALTGDADVRVRPGDAVLLLPEAFGAERLWAQLGALFRETGQRQDALAGLDRAAASGSLPALLQAAANALGRDMALYDSLGALLASSAHAQAHLSDEALAAAEPVTLDNETVAYLSPAGSEPLRPRVTELVKAALRRRERETPGQKFSSELLLMQLISGEPVSDAALSFRAGLCGWNVGGFFALMLSDLSLGPADKRRRVALLDALEAAGASPLIYDDTLALLLALKSPQELPSRAAAAGRVLEAAGCGGVYGRAFCSLRAVTRAYERLRAVLPLTAGGATCVRSFDALEPDYLVRLAGYESTRELHPLCQRLLELDGLGKFSFSQTVLRYLQCAQRPAETCAALGIHRNTLDYRLRRIEALAGLDFGDGDAMFRLMFSLLAARLLSENGAISPRTPG